MVRQVLTAMATGNYGSSTSPITEAYIEQMKERLRRRLEGLEFEVGWLTIAE